jgi:hypothetical protein
MIEPFLEHRPLLFSTAYRMLGSVAEAEDAVASLMTVLAEDSTLMSDGGGRVRAALRPIQGAERIARFLFGIQKNVPGNAEFRLENLNGGKGILVVSAGIPISVLTFNVTGGQIAGIYIISNPDKLRHLNHP